MSTVRILAITHQYPTVHEPTFAPYNRQQYAELARMHELRIVRPVSWLTARGAGRRAASANGAVDDNGIEVHPCTFFYPPGVLRNQYGYFFGRSVAPTVTRVLATYRPDVLLSAWAHPDGWAVTRLGRRLGLPTLVKVVGSDVLVLAKGSRRALVAQALTAADGVMAVSQDLAEHVAALGVPEAKVHVIPEGVALGRFVPGNRDDSRRRLGLPLAGRIILFAGGLRRTKGVLELVEACALLRDQGVAFTCWMVGEGADRTAVERLVRQRQLDGRIVLAGVRPHGELPDWYRASDVVALPSYSEGIPNVLREAMACGTPWVATRVGGIPEIADPTLSRLVAVRAIAELAEVLASMVAAPPVVDQARVRRLNISWLESAQRVAALLQSIVERHRHATPIASASGRAEHPA